MKFKHLLLIPLLSVLACRENAMGDYAPVEYYFEDSQPANVHSIKRFPSRFRGEYELRDGHNLHITNEVIYYDYPKNITVSLLDKDSVLNGYEFQDGKYISHNPYMEMKIDKANDSIYLSGFVRDTMFKLSERSVGKFYKGNLIISQKDSVFWNINVLRADKDSLYWKHLANDDYLRLAEYVKDITVSGDTTYIIVKPSRNELYELIKMKMGWQKSYKRIKN